MLKWEEVIDISMNGEYAMPHTVKLSSRQKGLLKVINESDYASIRDLAIQIEVSESTVRRDLDELSDGGFIGRVHGGAVKLASTTFERFHSEKMKIMTEEKRRIALAAAQMVKEGNSVFLDSGSTTQFIAYELTKKKNLTIVTDNIDIAYSVIFDASTNVILTGGLCRRDYSAVIGSLTEDTIRRFKVDITFIACDAVDPKTGIYNVNYLEIGVKNEIVKCGKKTVLVADHTKFNSSALAFVCPMEEIDSVITDNELDSEDVKVITEKAIELILV